MNMLTVILTALCIILIMGGVIYALNKRIKELKAEQKQLFSKIEQLNANISYIVKHSNELASIQKEQAEIRNKIEGAKDDEEISNIVSAIISANNDRVQNNKAKGK